MTIFQRNSPVRQCVPAASGVPNLSDKYSYERPKAASASGLSCGHRPITDAATILPASRREAGLDDGVGVLLATRPAFEGAAADARVSQIYDGTRKVMKFTVE